MKKFEPFKGHNYSSSQSKHSVTAGNREREPICADSTVRLMSDGKPLVKSKMAKMPSQKTRKGDLQSELKYWKGQKRDLTKEDHIISLEQFKISSKNNNIQEWTDELNSIHEKINTLYPWQEDRIRLMHQIYTICNSKAIPLEIREKAKQLYFVNYLHIKYFEKASAIDETPTLIATERFMESLARISNIGSNDSGHLDIGEWTHLNLKNSINC